MFYIVKNPEGTFRVECQIVVYKEVVDYPEFLLDYKGDERIGCNTTFCLLIDDDLTKEDAIMKETLYNRRYGQIVLACEKSGNWDMFPFKDRDVIYCK